MSDKTNEYMYWVLGGAFFAGGIGAEFEAYWLVRLANACLFACFMYFLVQAHMAGRALWKRVLFGLGALVCGYFTLFIWPTLGFWEVVGAILDAT